MRARDGRMFERGLTALARVGDDGTVEVLSPAVGQWRGGPLEGDLVDAGGDLGELEILGVMHRLVAPPEARGVVATLRDDARASRPVGYGDRLLVVDTTAAVGGAVSASDEGAANAHTGVVLTAPSSGRFYLRPRPEEPAFVEVGDVLAAGQTVCLLEVMKTFNRVTYGGAGLPERARVVAIRPSDEDDLDAGDVILDLEPA